MHALYYDHAGCQAQLKPRVCNIGIQCNLMPTTSTPVVSDEEATEDTEVVDDISDHVSQMSQDETFDPTYHADVMDDETLVNNYSEEHIDDSFRDG